MQILLLRQRRLILGQRTMNFNVRHLNWTNIYIYQVRKSIKPAKIRQGLEPGSVLILLAGRFRGKRVVLLKVLPQGVLLVTGPFKINGVPLRRVNARYVIATSTKVKLEGIDKAVVDKAAGDGYFTKDKPSKKVGEDAFFKQGEKPEVCRKSALSLPCIPPHCSWWSCRGLG